MTLATDQRDLVSLFHPPFCTSLAWPGVEAEDYYLRQFPGSAATTTGKLPRQGINPSVLWWWRKKVEDAKTDFWRKVILILWQICTGFILLYRRPAAAADAGLRLVLHNS